MNRTSITRSSRVLPLLAALVGVTGCESITNSVELADLTGSWLASDALFAEASNLNNRVDLTLLGWTVTTEIEADGTYTTVLLEPGAAPDSLTGIMTVENGKDVTVVRANQTVGQGEVFLEKEQVAFLFDETAGFEWDVHDNGRPVPVTLQLVMDRQ